MTDLSKIVLTMIMAVVIAASALIYPIRVAQASAGPGLLDCCHKSQCMMKMGGSAIRYSNGHHRVHGEGSKPCWCQMDFFSDRFCQVLVDSVEAEVECCPTPNGQRHA